MTAVPTTPAAPTAPAGRRSRWRRPSPWAVAVVCVFSVQPFVRFLDLNRAQVQQVGRLGLYAAATAIACLAVLLVLLRRPARHETATTAAIAVVVTSFFSFGLWLDPEPPTTAKLLVEMVVWGLVTAGLVRLTQLLSTHSWFRSALLLFGATLLLVPTATYASYRWSPSPTRDDGPSGEAADLGPVEIPADRPNVYWFMLDGYARQDLLEAQIGFDNTPFLDGLRGRDFQVSGSSRTSYPRTHLSTSSTLEMAYTSLPGDDLEDEFDLLAPVVLGDNATVDRFRELGYQYVYSYAGALEWSACRPALVDVCLPVVAPRFATGELERALLDLTPLGTFSNPSTYTDPLFVAEQVDARRGEEITEPFFLFSHVLTPHWPYRFDPDCNARAQPRDYAQLSSDEQKAEYEIQVRCINDLTLAGIDRILESDPTAIIIIQSDHGTSFDEWQWDLPFDEWDAQIWNERYSVLNTMRLPDRCNDPGIEGQPLVNTFRLVFACIERTDPQLLDHRAFIAPLDHPDQLEEVDASRFTEPAAEE